MSFDTQIQQIDSDALDQLFSNDISTADTPTPVTLVNGEDANNNQPIAINGSSNFDKVNLDDIPNADEEDVADPVKKAEKVVKKEEVEDETSDEDEKSDEEVADETKSQTPAEVAEVLKSTVDYLISSGQWVDFEGREDLEMTNEVYAELALKQNQQNAYDIVNDLIDETGIYGKAIIGHIKNGGNPDEVIDIFKEQREVETMDTSNETGKQAKIEKYYRDVLGWKPEKVKKTVDRLVEDNEIDSEFSDVNELFEKHYKDRLAEVNREAEREKAVKVEKQEKFKNSIKTVIENRTDLTPTERKVISDSILNLKHKLDNGQSVNDFYLKFAEAQADPESYIDLVHFVLDREGYKKRIKSTEETKAAKKAFTFIKGNAAIKKPVATQVDINDRSQNTQKGTNFSFGLKK